MRPETVYETTNRVMDAHESKPYPFDLCGHRRYLGLSHGEGEAVMNVTVLNPPLPAIQGKCHQAGCENEAQKRWYGSAVLCNRHFYEAYRAVEMQHDDSPEAA